VEKQKEDNRLVLNPIIQAVLKATKQHTPKIRVSFSEQRRITLDPCDRCEKRPEKFIPQPFGFLLIPRECCGSVVQ